MCVSKIGTRSSRAQGSVIGSKAVDNICGVEEYMIGKCWKGGSVSLHESSWGQIHDIWKCRCTPALEACGMRSRGVVFVWYLGPEVRAGTSTNMLGVSCHAGAR